MEYVLIFNGLGNQMSQFAFYLAKKEISPKCKLLVIDNKSSHNGYELNKVFGIQNKNTLFDKIISKIYKMSCTNRIWRLVMLLLNFHIIRESRNYDYNEDNFKKRRFGIYIYIGGWHSEKNFISVKDKILATFKFPECQSEDDFGNLLSQIRHGENSVSIHIRRGDYLNISPSSFWQFGGVCTDEYYKWAISYMEKNLPNPHFYIFSNDIEWCKNNLHLGNSTIVTCNQGINSWRDLQLMKECQHHIIANSSFSWWGAWLSKHEGITIRPKWFIRELTTRDFYPTSWIYPPLLTKIKQKIAA